MVTIVICLPPSNVKSLAKVLIEIIIMFPDRLVFLNTDMMDNMIIDLNYATLFLHILMVYLNSKGYLFCRFEYITFGNALDR